MGVALPAILHAHAGVAVVPAVRQHNVRIMPGRVGVRGSGARGIVRAGLLCVDLVCGVCCVGLWCGSAVWVAVVACGCAKSDYM